MLLKCYSFRAILINYSEGQLDKNKKYTLSQTSLKLASLIRNFFLPQFDLFVTYLSNIIRIIPSMTLFQLGFVSWNRLKGRRNQMAGYAIAPPPDFAVIGTNLFI